MSLVPRPKQIITFQKLMSNHRFLDRSQAGAGKTCPACCYTGFLIKQSPETLIELSKSPQTNKSLQPSSFLQSHSMRIVTQGRLNARAIWIQPTSLMSKNRDELLMWNSHLNGSEVKILKGTAAQKEEIVYDSTTAIWLMTAEAYSKYSSTMYKRYPDIALVVCDEPHMYYRGWTSKRTQDFVNNTPDHVRMEFMTATQTPRGKLTAAYIYCHMIQRDYYQSYDFFKHKHAIMDDYGNPTLWMNHNVLQKFLDNYSIGWTSKEMHGDMEEFVIREVCPLPEKMQKTYRGFEDLGVAEFEDVIMEGKSSGSNVMRLRQILAHPNKLKLPVDWDNKGNPIAFKDVEVMKGTTPKIDKIMQYAEEGEPIIVFATFAFEIEAIAAALQAKKYKVGVINGSVSLPKRNKIDQEFRNGDLDIIVASAATAGVGFNWGHVNTIIFHSLNYGDDEYLQAVARAKRGVRTQALRIVLLEYENTLDQYITWAIHFNSKNSNGANKDNPIIYFPKLEKEKNSNGMNDLLTKMMM